MCWRLVADVEEGGAVKTLFDDQRLSMAESIDLTAKITWEPEQDKWLCANRYRYTVAELTSAYNREATIQGWPSRTKAAIKQRLSRALQCRTRPYERPVINTDLNQTYRSVAAAATAMGVSEDSIRSAIQRDGLCQGYSWAYLDEWNGGD